MRKITNVPKDWTTMKGLMPSGKPGSLPFPVQAMPTKYCKRCGQLLLPYTTDDSGNPNYSLEEEMALGVCHKCYPKELEAFEKEMAKAMEAATTPTAEEKKVADEKYEEAVKKYMEELSKKNGSKPSTDT